VRAFDGRRGPNEFRLMIRKARIASLKMGAFMVTLGALYVSVNTLATLFGHGVGNACILVLVHLRLGVKDLLRSRRRRLD